MTLFYWNFYCVCRPRCSAGSARQPLFAGIEGAPSAVALTWLGPVIGALSRVGAGQVSDKIRGGRVTTVMAVCNIIGLLALQLLQTYNRIRLLDLAPRDVLGSSSGPAWATLPPLNRWLSSFPPLQGGAVVGWTSAVGAYGPFTIGMLLAECGAGAMFGISTLIFVAILAINVYYYDRRTPRIFADRSFSPQRNCFNWRTKCPES